MKTIEGKLFALHASLPQRENEISQTHESKNTPLLMKKKEKQVEKEEKKAPVIDYLTPFARISLVSQGSPAERAGLKVGDLLSQFDQINIYSLDWLKQIAGVVKESVVVSIVIMRVVEGQTKSEGAVFRLKDGNDYIKIKIQLTPSRWEGRGLLGCKIDPIDSNSKK